MTEFMIFVAPFLVLFGSIIVGFLLAMKDEAITRGPIKKAKK